MCIKKTWLMCHKEYSVVATQNAVIIIGASAKRIVEFTLVSVIGAPYGILLFYHKNVAVFSFSLFNLKFLNVRFLSKTLNLFEELHFI